MTTLALLQDPVGKGGTATAVYWYRRWMERHDPGSRELFLDEHGPGGWRRLRAWPGDVPAVPRVLPKLHLPPYWLAAARVRRLGIQADEVHVVGASAAHGALLAGRISLVWLATTFEDEWRHAMPRRSFSRRLLHSATLGPLSRLERRVIGEADRVLAMSHYTAELLTDNHIASESAVSVVPVPIDTHVYCPPPESERRRGVLFVGRAQDPRKGFERLMALVESSRLVRSRGLTVVSPGTAPKGLAAVRWMGRVQDLAEVYQRHELLVLPSHQEGLGIVVFEALACGTPVVAWRCGGPDRFLEESGGGVLVDSATGLRTVVEGLLSEPERLLQLGLAGRRYVEDRFSASNFLDDAALFR